MDNQLILLDDENPLTPDHGKDELNLADFPFAVLSRTVAAEQKMIEVIQEGREEAGRPIRQEWLVTGSDQFGLPTAVDDEIHVALMKLLRDDHFASRTVRFTVAQLLRIMRSGASKRDYKRVGEALDRLTGVTIRSKNAFWNHAKKCYVTEAFHLLDSYRLTTGSRELSEATLSGFLFDSIQAGYVKNLDIGFYFSLESPLARRYYRLLDKHRWRAMRYEIDIKRLAQKLPLQDRYPSQLRRRLDAAHAELIAHGYLESVAYHKNSRGETIAHILFAEAKKASISPVADAQASAENILDPAEALTVALTAQGVSKKTAADLVRDFSADAIRLQLDYLPHAQDVKNPGAYLRRAIEGGFGPPKELVAAQKRAEATQKRREVKSTQRSLNRVRRPL